VGLHELRRAPASTGGVAQDLHHAHHLPRIPTRRHETRQTVLVALQLRLAAVAELEHLAERLREHGGVVAASAAILRSDRDSAGQLLLEIGAGDALQAVALDDMAD